VLLNGFDNGGKDVGIKEDDSVQVEFGGKQVEENILAVAFVEFTH